jgi:MFS family permease
VPGDTWHDGSIGGKAIVQNSPVQKASNLWHPFKTPIFRNLIIADVVSDVGSFMQSVGAAWLMVSLHAGPLYVALIQTASALPFFLFALPAGALGDIVDRRKLILTAEIWMAGVAIILCVATIAGRATPILEMHLRARPGELLCRSWLRRKTSRRLPRSMALNLTLRAPSDPRLAAW